MNTENKVPLVVNRQPVLDQSKKLVAYELMFNDKDADGEKAKAQAIYNAFISIGIDRVSGSSPVIVNISRSFLMDPESIPFMPARAILSVDASNLNSKAALASLVKLHQKGFEIMAHLNDETLSVEALGYVSILKVKASDILEDTFLSLLTDARDKGIKILATDVEDPDVFDSLSAQRVDLFQGYFFCRPQVVAGRPLPESQTNLLKLLHMVQDEDVDFDDIENIIKKDPALSYKVMKLLNSAAMGVNREVKTINEALVLMGLKMIKGWITVVALSAINGGSKELMNVSLIRARMAQELSTQYGADPESAFMTGLFSNIDAMLNMKLETVLNDMPFDYSIKQAILFQEGDLGMLISDVITYERGAWVPLEERSVDLENFSDTFMAAAEWSMMTAQSM